MIAPRPVLLAVALAVAPAPSMAAGDTLAPEECPAFELPVEAYETRCYGFSRPAERAGLIRFDVAVFRPMNAAPDAPAVLYIPGGPGDAPVSGASLPETLFALFPDHLVIAFDPRGVLGTEPHLGCDFGAWLWREEFAGPEAMVLIDRCRERTEPALAGADFDAPAIAADIDALMRALAVGRAGLFAVSYGTEAALHLLARAPVWLDFAVLDSVSLPGVGGLAEEMEARTHFLDALQARCFGARLCGDALADAYRGLVDWAAQFDDAPLVFALGPDDTEWRLDAAEMLDYLYGLSAYPVGLDMAGDLVGQLETNRLRALTWMRLDLSSSIDFATDSLVLSVEAFSDSLADADLRALDRSGPYATDTQAWRDLVAVYRRWNHAGRREPPFTEGGRARAPVPVLILSGGMDAITPSTWAKSLSRRFEGLAMNLFPALGHAVSFGEIADTDDDDIAAQIKCAKQAVRSFRNAAAPVSAECNRFVMDASE